MMKYLKNAFIGLALVASTLSADITIRAPGHDEYDPRVLGENYKIAFNGVRGNEWFSSEIFCENQTVTIGNNCKNVEIEICDNNDCHIESVNIDEDLAFFRKITNGDITLDLVSEFDGNTDPNLDDMEPAKNWIISLENDNGKKRELLKISLDSISDEERSNDSDGDDENSDSDADRFSSYYEDNRS